MSNEQWTPTPQAIGTYVDGKTVYRKSFVDVAYKSNGQFTSPIDVTDLHIDKVVKLDAVRQLSGNRTDEFYPDAVHAYVYIDNGVLNGSYTRGATSVAPGFWDIQLCYTRADEEPEQ